VTRIIHTSLELNHCGTDRQTMTERGHAHPEPWWTITAARSYSLLPVPLPLFRVSCCVCTHQQHSVTE